MNKNIPDNPGNEHLDADLRDLAADLDRLGMADRAGAPTDMEDRLLQMTLAPLHGVVETSAQMSELGAIERAAARADLENRVHDASRGELGGTGSGLRLAGEGQWPKSSVVVRPSRMVFSGRMRALAAAVLVVGAGVATYIGVSSSSTSVSDTTTEAPRADQLAAQIDSEMNTLFVAMENVSLGTAESNETEFNPEWLDELTTGTTGGAS